VGREVWKRKREAVRNEGRCIFADACLPEFNPSAKHPAPFSSPSYPLSNPPLPFLLFSPLLEPQIATNSREWEERNRALRNEKEIMTRHYSGLKGSMDHFRAVQEARLKALSLTSNNAMGECMGRMGCMEGGPGGAHGCTPRLLVLSI
jgi:hypothetical protein